jgi:L-threonylcarbamoyladenylate synthase
VSYVTDSFDEHIIDLLKGGAVGFMPSDTIYGLSCRALNREAVEKLHKVKDRDEHRPFIVLISDIKMLDLLSINQEEINLAKKYWPGALTIICKVQAAPPWLTLHTDSLAIRLPDHVHLRKLIDKTGPLISTSANKQGMEPITSASEAQKQFGDQLDFYIDAGQIGGVASTIVKKVDGKLEVLRQGAVKIDEKEL